MAASQTIRSCVAAAFLPLGRALMISMKTMNATTAIDEDRPLEVEELVDGEGCLGGWNAINPSFSPLDGGDQFAVVFRGLCMTKAEGRASWFSDLVMGTIDAEEIRGSRDSFNWTSLQLAPDPRLYGNARTMRECAIPELDVAKGPEDPRLVHTKAGTYVIVTGYDILDETSASSPECKKHGILLYATEVTSLSPPVFQKPVPLTFEGMGMVEKNWAMFTPPDSEGADVHAIYSIHPHRIIDVSLSTGRVKFIAESKAFSVVKLAQEIGVEADNFHGGSGVAYVGSADPGYFLSMMHVAVRNADGVKEYWNFPYKFRATPPYDILHIGKLIPLSLKRNPAYGEMVAFVTTLMLDGDDVFVAYGSGDSESRTIRMPYSEFNDRYFPSSLPQDEVGVAEELAATALRRLAPRLGIEEHPATCVAKFEAGCHDDLTPSVCRACSTKQIP